MYLETERLVINNLQFLTDLDSDPAVRKFIDGKVKTADETRLYTPELVLF
jgi:hypothetical protein